jgi:4-hydroxybutyrate CoA-transferase
MGKQTDWREAYRSRLLAADDAMRLINEGDLVKLNVGTPPAVAALLDARARELDVLNIRSLAPGYAPLAETPRESGEHEIEIFIGDPFRPSHDARRSTYLPTTFMLGLKAFDAGREEARIPDVNLVPCSAPNDAGYVHFGPTHWLRKSYLERCKTTIGFVDPNMTPVHGDVWSHVSEFSAFVEGALPALDLPRLHERIANESPAEHQERLLRLTELVPPERLTAIQDQLPLMDPGFLEGAMNLGAIDDEAMAIAGHLKELIRDGDTIQVGVGTPSTLMFNAGAFDDAHDLGLHTELGSPGLAKLWDRGVLTNSKKSIHRGVGVAVAWSGCDGEDMAIIRDNPAFELYDPHYLLHPTLMSQNNQMTSINSAVAVDLLGQIASEDRYGGQMINGTGGQPDTHLGASLCRNGRAITVLRSTAVGGSISKITAKHEAGTLVTIPRYLADTVITEYGVARLLDKNHRQRAEELISIAHPDFRPELRKQALELWG